MKRARFLLLSIVSLTLLMNFPASGLIPGGSAAETIATASPFFASEDVDIIGVFENGDLAGWSSINPSEILDRKPITGLLSGEKINTIETIPDSASLNSISDHLDGLSISGISNRGNLYNIDYQTGNASFIRLISLFEGNPRLSYTYHHFTRVGLLINVDLGMQYGINPFTGVVLSTGPTNFFYRSGDVNFGKTPKITGWEIPIIDHDNDGDVDIFAIDDGQNTLVEIGNNGGLSTRRDLPISFLIGEPEFSGPVLDCGGLVIVSRLGNPAARESNFIGTDLNTGQTIDYGPIGDGTDEIRDFTSASEDNPLCLKPSNDKRPPRNGVFWLFFGGSGDRQPFNFNFEVINGPNRGVAGTGTTDANRRGTFNYTGNSQTGIDTVLVTAFVDSEVSATSKVEWTDGPIIEMVSRSGKHVIIDGFFKRGDMVDINGEMASKIKYRNCDIDDFCRQLFLKKAFRLLNENPCINNVARSNLIRAYRNPLGSPAPPIQDTSAFATCP